MATLPNFHYQLFDLDPTDGITPAVVFADDGTFVFSSATPDNYASFDVQSNSGPFGSSLSVSSLLGSTSASASTTAGNPQDLDAGAAGLAVASAAGAETEAYAYSFPLYSSFMLTPHSSLVFAADASGLNATATMFGEFAYAETEIDIYSDNGLGGLGLAAFDYALTYVDPDGSTGSDGSNSLSVSYSNLTDSVAYGFGFAQAYVDVGDFAPVSEPRSDALVVAALLAMGALINRRRMVASNVLDATRPRPALARSTAFRDVAS
jgi:hypothetical protein